MINMSQKLYLKDLTEKNDIYFLSSHGVNFFIKSRVQPCTAYFLANYHEVRKNIFL